MNRTDFVLQLLGLTGEVWSTFPFGPREFSPFSGMFIRRPDASVAAITSSHFFFLQR